MLLATPINILHLNETRLRLLRLRPGRRTQILHDSSSNENLDKAGDEALKLLQQAKYSADEEVFLLLGSNDFCCAGISLPLQQSSLIADALKYRSQRLFPLDPNDNEWGFFANNNGKGSDIAAGIISNERWTKLRESLQPVLEHLSAVLPLEALLSTLLQCGASLNFIEDDECWTLNKLEDASLELGEAEDEESWRANAETFGLEVADGETFTLAAAALAASKLKSSQFPFLRLSGLPANRRRGLQTRLTAILAVLAIVLLLVVVGSRLNQRNKLYQENQKVLQAERARIGALEDLRPQLERLRELNREFYQIKIKASPAPELVMAQLSKILPRDCYVDKLQIDGARVKLIGIHRPEEMKDSELTELIEEQPLFSQAIYNASEDTLEFTLLTPAAELELSMDEDTEEVQP